jgi:hypothetical protein
MSEPGSPFTVGQRAYWVYEQYSFGYMFRHRRSGVVMSTGPAVTQVWNDNDPDPREHHALTFANDQIWADYHILTGIILDRVREAEAASAADAERAGPVPGAELKPSKRRWFWWWGK